MSANTLVRIAVSLGMSVCLVLAGCTLASTTGSTSAAKAGAGKHVVLAVGESADYDGLEIAVVSAKRGPKTFDGSPSFVAEVTYKNGTEDAVSFDEFDWSVQDTNGIRSQKTARFDIEVETLGSGRLEAGESKEGSIYFSRGTDVQRIIYAPSMAAGEQDLTSWAVK